MKFIFFLAIISLISLSTLCRRENIPVSNNNTVNLKNMGNKDIIGIRYKKYIIGEHFKFTGLIAGDIEVQQQDNKFYNAKYWFNHERDSTKWTVMKYSIDKNNPGSSNLEIIDSQVQKLPLKYINEKEYQVIENTFKILKFTSGSEEDKNYQVHLWSQNFGLIMVCSSSPEKYFEVVFVEDRDKDNIVSKLIDSIKRDRDFYPLETGEPVFDPN